MPLLHVSTSCQHCHQKALKSLGAAFHAKPARNIFGCSVTSRSDIFVQLGPWLVKRDHGLSLHCVRWSDAVPGLNCVLCCPGLQGRLLCRIRKADFRWYESDFDICLPRVWDLADKSARPFGQLYRVPDGVLREAIACSPGAHGTSHRTTPFEDWTLARNAVHRARESRIGRIACSRDNKAKLYLTFLVGRSRRVAFVACPASQLVAFASLSPRASMGYRSRLKSVRFQILFHILRAPEILFIPKYPKSHERASWRIRVATIALQMASRI